MNIIVVCSDDPKINKTLISAALAKLLDGSNIPIKFLRLNPTLSQIGGLWPAEAGEAFVTTDGGLSDPETGIVERAIKFHFDGKCCLTLGQAVADMTASEMKKSCDYRVMTIEGHLTAHIRNFVQTRAEESCVLIVEIGGSVEEVGGRIFANSVSRLDPFTIFAGADPKRAAKIFSREPDVAERDVHSAADRALYVVSAHFKLGLAAKSVQKVFTRSVSVAIVGAYESAAYQSVIDSMAAACRLHEANFVLKYVQSKSLTRDNVREHLQHLDGVIIPGGFGDCGMEGKITAIQFCRENNKPLLAICLGLQLAVVEHSRNVLGLTNANTTELDPDCEHQVIHRLPPLPGCECLKYGSMRVGGLDVHKTNHVLAQLFMENEKHSHSFGINMQYWKALEESGMRCLCWNKNKDLVVAVTVEGQRYYVATQFHPEFMSKDEAPHGVFGGLVEAAMKTTE